MALSRLRILVPALFLTCFLTPACNSRVEEAKEREVKAPKDRKKAPDFKLKDMDGRSVELADYKGKVVLLNFWATWCSPCRIEIPWFMEFEQEFKDKGFAVLGVAMDEEGWEVVKPYAERTKINYRLVMGDDITAQLYGGVESLPMTFVVDKDGNVASTHVGLVSKSVYRNEIVQLLD